MKIQSVSSIIESQEPILPTLSSTYTSSSFLSFKQNLQVEIADEFYDYDLKFNTFHTWRLLKRADRLIQYRFESSLSKSFKNIQNLKNFNEKIRKNDKKSETFRLYKLMLGPFKFMQKSVDLSNRYIAYTKQPSIHVKNEVVPICFKIWRGQSYSINKANDFGLMALQRRDNETKAIIMKKLRLFCANYESLLIIAEKFQTIHRFHYWAHIARLKGITRQYYETKPINETRKLLRSLISYSVAKQAQREDNENKLVLLIENNQKQLIFDSFRRKFEELRKKEKIYLEIDHTTYVKRDAFQLWREETFIQRTLLLRRSFISWKRGSRSSVMIQNQNRRVEILRSSIILRNSLYLMTLVTKSRILEHNLLFMRKKFLFRKIFYNFKNLQRNEKSVKKIHEKTSRIEDRRVCRAVFHGWSNQTALLIRLHRLSVAKRSYFNQMLTFTRMNLVYRKVDPDMLNRDKHLPRFYNLWKALTIHRIESSYAELSLQKHLSSLDQTYVRYMTQKAIDTKNRLFFTMLDLSKAANATRKMSAFFHLHDSFTAWRSLITARRQLILSFIPDYVFLDELPESLKEPIFYESLYDHNLEDDLAFIGDLSMPNEFILTT